VRLPQVTVSRRAAERARAGHPWIYRSDVVAAEVEPGALVSVATEREQRLGLALWSSASQIALRFLTGPGQVLGATSSPPDDRSLLTERLRAAVGFRSTLDIDATAWRVVNGEADRLPALVVDHYAGYLVVQTLCEGMDLRIGLITELLGEILEPRGILARNDPKVRRLEGLEQRVDVLAGDVPDVIEIREGAVRQQVDLRQGQKTGSFLDQRENHVAAAKYVRGRALDAFTYHGGFALAMAAKAEHVLALDSSATAVEATRQNARLNDLQNVEVREANVFDELRELEVSGQRFQMVVLDPPAFAKNRASVDRAIAGYKEINLRALRMLEPGGYLMTSSCSYNINEGQFEDIVHAAAVDARLTVSLVEKRMQARDHPVLVGVPETHYLKCLVLRRLA
jgi:23S rRNA (cytosine1962-C5)-methyltransferase